MFTVEPPNEKPFNQCAFTIVVKSIPMDINNVNDQSIPYYGNLYQLVNLDKCCPILPKHGILSYIRTKGRGFYANIERFTP